MSYIDALKKIAKPVAAVGVLLLVLDYTGIGTLEFIVYSLVSLTYLGLCSVLWLVAYLEDLESGPKYYAIVLLTAPFIGLVKILTWINLFDLIERKLNAQARKMGVPDTDDLLSHLETQTDDVRE